MAEPRVFAVDENFDFPAPVAARQSERQAARLGDATTAEGKALKAVAGLAVANDLAIAPIFKAHQVKHPATLAEIKAILATAAATPGGVVQFAAGKVYDNLSGTIYFPSGVTIEGNGAELKAAPNAAFEVPDFGNPLAVPQFTKLFCGVIGTPAKRHKKTVIRNLKINGNGANQAASGSFTNLAVVHANGTMLENVESIDSGTAVAPGTSNEGICLLVEHSDSTLVYGGNYEGAGYDAIRVAGGALDTKLYYGRSARGARSSLQITPLSYFTTIMGWTLDNRGIAGQTNYGLFGHNARDVHMLGGTIFNDQGSCVMFFGDSQTDRNAYTNNVNMSGVEMVASDGATGILIEAENVRGFTAKDCTVKLLGIAGHGMIVRGKPNVRATASNYLFENIQIQSERTLSRTWGITDCDGVTIRGGFTNAPDNVTHYVFAQNAANLRVHNHKSVQPLTGESIALYLIACDGVEWRGNKPTAKTSVRVKSDSTNVDLFDNDLRGILEANKLTLYGPSAGRIRGNTGATTEANGDATLTAGNTSVTITHGLWGGTGGTTDYMQRKFLPKDFQVSFAGNPGAAKAVWVSAVTGTNVTFTVDVTPGADVALAWSARMDRAS